MSNFNITPADPYTTVCSECESEIGNPCVYYFYNESYPRLDVHEVRQETADYEADLREQGICSECQAGEMRVGQHEGEFVMYCDTCNFVDAA